MSSGERFCLKNNEKDAEKLGSIGIIMKKCYLNIPGDPRIVVSTVLLVPSVITPVLISPYAEA